MQYMVYNQNYTAHEEAGKCDDNQQNERTITEADLKVIQIRDDRDYKITTIKILKKIQKIEVKNRDSESIISKEHTKNEEYSILN